MTTDIPLIADLNSEQLTALRSAIETRLDEIRAVHIQQAEALGLTLVPSDGKKPRKRRAGGHKEE